jgi:hypothetical protein
MTEDIELEFKDIKAQFDNLRQFLLDFQEFIYNITIDMLNFIKFMYKI